MPSSALFRKFLSTRRRLRAAASAAVTPLFTRPLLEPLEDRTLFSEAATAQLNLVSTTGTVQTPVYNYDITLNDTGSTKIGSFWFAWVPGSDFLPNAPSNASSPAGWGNASGTSSTPEFTNEGISDGTALQWVAQSPGAQISAGHSLDGFTFSTVDSPAVLAGNSPFATSTPVLTSFVYQGAPESPPDVSGFEFTVTAASTQVASTTTLMSSNPTSSLGQSVTLTATVTPQSGSGATPTGTVTFKQGGATLGSGPVAVQGDGTAALTLSTLPIGDDNITAVYSGDSAYITSTSLPLDQTVNPGATMTGLQTSAQSINSGASATFTATVAAVSAGGPTPTGSVTFTADGNLLGTATVQPDGTASLLSSLPSLSTGTHSILASYGGDSNYASSLSTTLSETVNGTAADTSSTTLMSSSPTVNAGNSVTFTATVAAVTPGDPAPTGSVTFTSDGNALGTTSLSSGTATFATSALTAGTHSILATFTGDSLYATSVSQAVSQTVNAPVLVATTTALATSSASANAGSAVNFTATITPATSGAVPTGTVTFTSDGTSIGSAPVQSDGTATLPVSSLTVGTHAILASYGGDNNYSASASSSLTQAIVTPPTLAPTIIKSTIPSAIVAGAASHGVVKVDVTNETASQVKGKSTIALYASTDGVIDSSSTLLVQATHGFNLKPGKLAVVSLAAKSLLATLAANSYTLLVRVIDPSSNPTDSTSGPMLTVAAPFIALSEAYTKLTLTGTAAAGATTKAAAAIKITNNGNIITPGTTTVSFFLSANGVVDSNATLIRSITKSLRIKPGKAASVALPLKQIPTVAAGNYAIVAQVTDPNGQNTTVVSATMVTITA